MASKNSKKSSPTDMEKAFATLTKQGIGIPADILADAETNLKCNFCGKTFATTTHLADHLDEHI